MADTVASQSFSVSFLTIQSEKSDKDFSILTNIKIENSSKVLNCVGLIKLARRGIVADH